MIKDTVVAWDGHITLEPLAKKAVVAIGGVEVLSTVEAIALTEGGRGPTYYFPKKDLDASKFTDSDLSTHCPWKGDASYLHYVGGADQIDDVVWMYPSSKEEIPELADYVAFYPDKVEVSIG